MRRQSDDFATRPVYHLARCFLALAFLAYGTSKLLDLQFAWGYELFDKPIRRVGGMGLVWAFFAYSRPYQVCIGCVEILPAALLLTRRTAVLGMLAYLPVIINVVLVDLCYGVQGDATMVALALLACDLWLLGLERQKLREVFTILTRIEPIRTREAGGRPQDPGLVSPTGEATA